MSHLPRHIVHVTFPSGYTIEVMRWSNHMGMRVTMPPQPGQDGHCGNANNNAADDTTDRIRARVGYGVPQSQSLFRAYMPAVPGKRENLDDCPAAKKIQAQQECQAAGRSDLHACMFDACFAGKQY